MAYSMNLLSPRSPSRTDKEVMSPVSPSGAGTGRDDEPCDHTHKN